MADDTLLNKVHGLSDLELAGLLCLMNREHCLISTPQEALDDLIDELQLIAAKTFGLRCAVVNCDPYTTVDDFASAILLSQPTSATQSPSPYSSRNNPGAASTDSYFVSRPGALTQLAPITASNPGRAGSRLPSTTSSSTIANVIIARDLDRAPQAVQIQALELLRTRRIFTRTSIQAAPKQFLFVATLGSPSGGLAKVTLHLNDFFYLAHWHDPDDGFSNLEEENYGSDSGSETASLDSVVRKSGGAGGEFAGPSANPVFRDEDIATLGRRSRSVNVDVDVLRYQMNIVSFLRMHRAVGGGISPTATKHFEQLAKSLAPLHGLEYVTPSLVALALKKVYLHRITIVQPEQERSMQWGSQLEAVQAILEDFGPEEAMEEVLAMVPTPF